MMLAWKGWDKCSCSEAPRAALHSPDNDGNQRLAEVKPVFCHIAAEAVDDDEATKDRVRLGDIADVECDDMLGHRSGGAGCVRSCY